MIPHSWDISSGEAVDIQRRLAGQVRVEPLAGEVRSVAGVDCAFPSADTILAAAVLCDADSMEILATASARLPCRFPYVSGLLSFREAPAVIAAVEALVLKAGPVDLLMCDGQGLAHPRGLGLASHVGLWLDVPTIGVAKSRLVGVHRPVGVKRGSRSPLRYRGEVIGSVVRTRDNVKPLYISVGHRITLNESVDWVLRAGRGLRLPEPTRQADRLVGQLKSAG